MAIIHSQKLGAILLYPRAMIDCICHERVFVLFWAVLIG
ncbi:hypothetical protein I546_4011 [Mycobacterium kansasii 732]|uniref:Uncharacterized protein n=1 Tax=Mycobacterium kansasii TaxID=1768 RepID=A0A1V3WCT4_MYCKA|nr:hypothetical protein I546_4011 [Mycobacterium kansasii 732]OOK64226.1 hypothetical protein BZL30_9270 [Mycobacterium kansasii]